VDNLSVDRRLVARRVYASLRAQGDVLIIDSVRGSFAGGQIDAAGRVALSDGRGTLQIRLGAINASRGLMFLSPNAENWGAGILSGRLTLESDRTYRVRGAVVVRDSRVFGIPTGAAHASLVGSAERDLSRWSLSLHSIESAVDQGRLLGTANLRSSSARPGAFDLTSQWTARRLDFGRLLDEAGGSGRSYARGNMNGTLTLNGTGIRSAVDLTGRFNAELAGSQARAFPGLISAQAYLGAFSLAGTRFEEGGVRGTIGAGMARIEDFWLLSSRLQVLARGRIFLASGYMDMDAVIATGNFDLANVAITAIAEQLAVGAALPIAAIIRVNRFLSNRTLFVEVQGLISDPRLRLRPVDTLRQGARRFLVREAAAAFAPIAVGGSAILNRSDR
jgi:translocation and assembly module TamB